MKILIFILLSINCLVIKSQNIDSLSNIKIELSEMGLTIPVYSPDTILFSVLDRITRIESGCPNYETNQKIFYFFISKEDNNYRLSIVSSTMKDVNYENCFGLFNYQGVKIICKGECIKHLFHKSNQYPIRVKYRRNQSSKGIIDDSFSEWVYIFSGNKMKLVYERLCQGYKKQN